MAEFTCLFNRSIMDQRMTHPLISGQGYSSFYANFLASFNDFLKFHSVFSSLHTFKNGKKLATMKKNPCAEINRWVIPVNPYGSLKDPGEFGLRVCKPWGQPLPAASSYSSSSYIFVRNHVVLGQQKLFCRRPMWIDFRCSSLSSYVKYMYFFFLGRTQKIHHKWFS